MSRTSCLALIPALLLGLFFYSPDSYAQGGPVNNNPVVEQGESEVTAPPSEATPLDNSVEQAEAVRAVQEAVAIAKQNVKANIVAVAPALPPTIQALVNSGARVEYLGRHQEFDGWIILNNGAPSYVYMSPDGKSIFRGFLFDDQGNAVTLTQVAEAQIRNPEFFGIDPDTIESAVEKDVARGAGKTLYDALSVSNYFTMGDPSDTARVLYIFVDPDCPHCKRFIRDAYPKYLENNQIQLRVIPIGILTDESAARAATLLESQDPATLMRDHAFDTAKIEADNTLSLEAQSLNVNLFTLWQFGGTPILVFKDKQGEIQMVRGTPNDLDATINLIGNGS